MASERLTALFGKMKKGLSERRSELKPEDIAKFAAKEAVGAIPIVGQIIKDAFDEFSSDEKEELIKELKELSEGQFKEISEKVGVSAEYLKDIRKITLYTFEELQADHEEIKKLLLHLIEIQTRGVEVKPPEISIPTIQSVLRKGETFEGDFFKKEPEWIDFEEGFVVERKEVDEIINKLENDNIQLVLGEQASGKSMILKNIGFKLAKENKDIYIVELKKHSRDEVKRYFDDIPEIKDEKTVFIVDDAHLLPSDCDRLVREFKNRELKAKLIIGSRPTGEIRGEHPKEVSEFEYLSKTDIHAEDVTEEMIRRFLKRKYGFSDERIKTVSKNIEKYKKDLWHLSWALKAYDPKKDLVEEEEIYKKIRDSIRDINAGKGEPRVNGEDVFLPLSVFNSFEIPIERDFLEELLGIEGDKINKLIELSEIIETEEIGRNRMLSLIHSSVAGLFFETFQAYPSLGRTTKKKILNQKDKDLQYCLFYKYMTSTDTKNVIDIVICLGDNFIDKTGRQTLLKKLVEDNKIEYLIKRCTEKEKEIYKIGLCVLGIGLTSKEVGLKIANCINIDNLISKIEREEDIWDIGRCVLGIGLTSKEVGLKIANRINIDNLISKIEKEENMAIIGSCAMAIAKSSEEVALKLVEVVLSKIEKEKDAGTIGWCMENIAGGSKEVALRLATRINIDNLLSKIEIENDIWKIGLCVRGIAKASKKMSLNLVNRVNINVLSSKIEKEGDIIGIGMCVSAIADVSEELALKLTDSVSSRIEKEKNVWKIRTCIQAIVWVNEKIARVIFSRLNPKLRKELLKG